MMNHNPHDKFRTRNQGGHGGPRGFGPNWAENMRRAAEQGVPGPHGGDLPFGRGFGPRPPFGPGFGGPGQDRRAPRGSVNLALLDLLLDGESNGYGLMQKFSERTNGRWAPKSGTIYPALGTLVKQQLIDVSDEGVYSLTATGRVTAEKSHDSAQLLFDHMAEEEAEGDLFRAGRDLMKALWTLFTQGTPEQQAAITAKLDELRKEIYRTLGE
jgi:DNA-binding PadR family transcriptional regulator